jgi:hypothetical protein
MAAAAAAAAAASAASADSVSFSLVPRRITPFDAFQVQLFGLNRKKKDCGCAGCQVGGASGDAYHEYLFAVYLDFCRPPQYFWVTMHNVPMYDEGLIRSFTYIWEHSNPGVTPTTEDANAIIRAAIHTLSTASDYQWSIAPQELINSRAAGALAVLDSKYPASAATAAALINTRAATATVVAPAIP